MNERTNTLLYKNIPLTLYSKGLRKGWCWLYVRSELETGTDCYILTQSSSDHSSTSFSFCWAAQLKVTRGRKPSVCKLILTLVSCPQLTPTATELELTDWLKLSAAPGYIIVWRPPASCGCTHLHRIQPRPQVKVIFRHPRPDAPALPFFCLFTQVHLLIDSLVEGQYVTKWSNSFISNNSI